MPTVKKLIGLYSRQSYDATKGKEERQGNNQSVFVFFMEMPGTIIEASDFRVTRMNLMISSGTFSAAELCHLREIPYSRNLLPKGCSLSCEA